MGLFFNHFWSFLPAGDLFSRNLALSHTIIYGLLTPYYVSEKLNEPIPRKIIDRRKDGRTEGRMDRKTYFIGAFPKWLEVKKINANVWLVSGLLTDNIGHHCVAILLAEILLWAPFSQSICTFSFFLGHTIMALSESYYQTILTYSELI